MTRYSAQQVPQYVGSALQLFPLPSEWRHDEKSGNESSSQDFRSTRPSLAVNYMAHVADSQRFLLQGPLFSKTSARADSQKRRLGPREQHLFFSQAQRKPAMRTATDFNLYYAAPDPWHISHARFRDKVLRRCLKPFIRRDKSVLELGCGEGHLTQTIFGKARSVVGIDISDVAITRAKSLNLPNARFESADFLQASFEGYDVIAALECVYYLSFQEQGVFLEKVAKEHPGKILLLSGPIVDYRRHFSHKRLMHEFTTLGFTPLKFYNLSVYWYPPSSRIIANLIKLPLGYTLLDWIPESMIYQRLYALRAPKRP